VAIAYFGNRYGRASRILQNLLPIFALGVGVAVYLDAVAELARLGGGLPVSAVNIATAAGMPWLMWFVLLALLRRLSGGIDHPPVDDRPLPASRAGLFWLVFVTFAIIFMPVPLRASLGAAGEGPNRVIQQDRP
jgi:hypothetical protein